MKLVIKPYDALPCALEHFTINGENASIDDFGSTCDTGPDSSSFFSDEEERPYHCSNRQFVRNDDIEPGVLEKYKITEKEYDKICSRLENELCVGSCGWCE